MSTATEREPGEVAPTTRGSRTAGWTAADHAGRGLAVLAVLPLVLTDRVETVAVRTLIFAIMAVGWNLMSGYGGMFSFGHAAFFGIGAYTDAYLLTEHDARRGSRWSWRADRRGRRYADRLPLPALQAGWRVLRPGHVRVRPDVPAAGAEPRGFNKTEGFNIAILP